MNKGGVSHKVFDEKCTLSSVENVFPTDVLYKRNATKSVWPFLGTTGMNGPSCHDNVFMGIFWPIA